MSVLVLDAGNLIIKAKVARREQGEIAFPTCLDKVPGQPLAPLMFPGVRLEFCVWRKQTARLMPPGLQATR